MYGKLLMLYCLVGKLLCYLPTDSILKRCEQLNAFYEYYYYLDVVRSIYAKCGFIVV